MNLSNKNSKKLPLLRFSLSRTRPSQRGEGEMGLLMIVFGLATLASIVLIAQTWIKSVKYKRMGLVKYYGEQDTVNEDAPKKFGSYRVKF